MAVAVNALVQIQPAGTHGPSILGRPMIPAMARKNTKSRKGKKVYVAKFSTKVNLIETQAELEARQLRDRRVMAAVAQLEEAERNLVAACVALPYFRLGPEEIRKLPRQRAGW